MLIDIIIGQLNQSIFPFDYFGRNQSKIIIPYLCQGNAILSNSKLAVPWHNMVGWKRLVQVGWLAEIQATFPSDPILSI